jgi:hypothetical protein
MKISVFWDVIPCHLADTILTNVFEEQATSIFKVGNRKLKASGPFVMLVNIY